MAALMQARADKTVSEKFEYVTFEIWRRRKINDIVFLPRCLMRVIETLSETDEFLEPVAQMVRMEANRITEVRSKREEQFKRFGRMADKSASVRSSSSSENPPTNISDDRTK